MKSKVYLVGIASMVAIALVGCKPKQSAYQNVYDAAKEKETTVVEEVTPVEKPKTPAPAVVEETFQSEKITAVDGDGIKDYSVVIGSFINKTNATNLRNRMQSEGYKAFLAQNEKGMYRVIVATFDDKSSASAERDRIKSKYGSDFSDAWVLMQAK